MNDKDLPATTNSSPLTPGETGLYDRVSTHLAMARRNIIRSVHTEMLTAYWNIGREIVEEEQKGAARAGYGKGILNHLSEQLTRDFGPGYGG